MKKGCRERNPRDEQRAEMARKVESAERELRAMHQEFMELLPEDVARAQKLSNQIYELIEENRVPFGAAIMGTGATLGGLLLAYLKIRKEAQP